MRQTHLNWWKNWRINWKAKAGQKSSGAGYQGQVVRGGVQYIPYFATDNNYDAYPYYLIDLLRRSGTLASAIDLDRKVISGSGFAVEALNKMVVNRSGHTVSQILKDCTWDYCLFGGFAIAVKFNALGKIVSAKHAPFERCRLGLPDENHNINQIFYTYHNDFLEREVYKTDSQIRVDSFNRFINNQDIMKKRIIEFAKELFKSNEITEAQYFQAIDAYPGDVFYFSEESPGSRFYPRPKYESVIQDAEAEGDVKENIRYDVQDRFKPTTIIVEYGVHLLTDEEREKKREEMSEYSGPEAPRIMYMTAQNKESAPSIQTVSQPDINKSYEWAETSRQNNIRRKFLYPDILYGIAQAGKLGQTEEIESTVTYANFLALPYRMVLEEKFKEIFSLFDKIQETNPTLNFDILPFNPFGKTETYEGGLQDVE